MINKIENNVLLAEFLGSELEETLKGEKVYCLLMPDENDISGFKKEFFAPDELKFHKSWEWLMLVVDKIESLTIDETDCAGVEIHTHHVEIQVFSGRVENQKTFLIHIPRHYPTKLEATYSACIEFVKWFNSQNK